MFKSDTAGMEMVRLIRMPWQRRRRMRQNLPTQRLHKRLLPYRIVCRRPARRNRGTTSDVFDSEPTVFENYVHDIFIDNVHVELSLWDTAGQEEFDRLRSLSYDDTHAIMLCFSVDSPDSLENVESKWVGEIAENCPGVKLVLVALKCDLREVKKEDEDEDAAQEGEGGRRQMVDYKQGLAVAEKIKALRYLGEFVQILGYWMSVVVLMVCVECSAMKNRGVNEAFTEAARVALQVKNVKGDKSGGCCTIM
jgi:Rho family protein